VTELSTVQIRELLPHRYPFLLVDRILELEEGQRAVGIKAVTVNEPFFVGHFPQYPVMPGVLIAEALAQVAGVVAAHAAGTGGRVAFLTGLDNFRFRRQVTPGDLLRLEVTMMRFKPNAGRAHGIATVDGSLVAEGDVTFVAGEARDR